MTPAELSAIDEAKQIVHDVADALGSTTDPAVGHVGSDPTAARFQVVVYAATSDEAVMIVVTYRPNESPPRKRIILSGINDDRWVSGDSVSGVVGVWLALDTPPPTP